ncbi:GNAT family N-acetyltransferase [Tunturiibacter empetritectus]|uniref:Ribosomal-protein-alanine N-acetyltransferase n=2 Tax=Tunturiibacter TaxID=3154218 RepID=A0A852VMF1_9BACT|nr:ribosomal-protein-alanine N-acetyltransferase [Edaphobacter lichenicola]
MIQLEKATPEAPHWAEMEYGATVSPDESQAAMKRCLFIAEAESGLLGFAVGKVLVSETFMLAELESVAVSASARRVGVGRALCEAVLGWCREHGATVMELEVRAGGVGAVALYEGLGFAVVGQRSGYYRDPTEDALLMRLRLAEDE